MTADTTPSAARPVLVITSLEDVTANLVIAALNDRRVPVVRIDPADIGDQLDFAVSIGTEEGRWRGIVRTTSRELDVDMVRSVYHRRPSEWRFAQTDPRVRDFAAREARHGLAGMLAHLPVLHVNAPAAGARAEYKPVQLQTAAALGLAVPDTLITNDVSAAKAFADRHGSLVYKTFRGVPPTDGMTGAIWTQRIDPADFDSSIRVTAHMFQAEIDKFTDVRVTVIGRRVFASSITAPGMPLDWRSADWDLLEYADFELPADLVPLLHAYLDAFGLVSGFFDFAVERAGGRILFLECNPNGQWGFLPNADAIADAFADVLQAGCHP